MRKAQDLTKKTFGRWTVQHRAGSNARNIPLWHCFCVCGNEKDVPVWALVYGHSKSCGCLQRDVVRRMSKETIGIPRANRCTSDAASRKLFRIYRDTSATRGYEFNLTYDEFLKLTSSPCSYCGASPSRIAKAERLAAETEGGAYLFNGIDRVNNLIGYVFSNCVPCCRACNVAKARMSESEFLELVERIYLHRIARRRLSVVAS